LLWNVCGEYSFIRIIVTWSPGPCYSYRSNNTYSFEIYYSIRHIFTLILKPLHTFYGDEENEEMEGISVIYDEAIFISALKVDHCKFVIWSPGPRYSYISPYSFEIYYSIRHIFTLILKPLLNFFMGMRKCFLSC
jgi:hypothetical protein